ncbi:MAG: hypothetical protein QOI80_643, partial [Solirubrobacteraceae bacterium]|nr:hypothetical protein [Solirubrobacteraceae bacterium]
MTATGVVVLGMHRSGTSAVTRCINLLGVPTCVPGDLNRDRTANLRGHWESATLVRRNEGLLRAAGAAWWCPPPLDADWTAIAGDQMPAAAAAFDHAHPTPSWVCKDPRTCVTAPFWQRALPHRLVYLLAVRHPLAVAASLTTRNGFTTPAGLAVWEGYMTRAARAAAGAPTFVSSFEAMVADPLAWARELRSFVVAAGVGLAGSGSPQLAARSVERSLTHHPAPASTDGLSDEQAVLLAELGRLSGAHESLTPQLPPPCPTTEALFAEQRHRLLGPEAEAAAPVPPSDIPLLHPRPRGPAAPSIGVVIAPRRAGASVGDTLRALLATAPASVEVVAVGVPDAP